MVFDGGLVDKMKYKLKKENRFFERAGVGRKLFWLDGVGQVGGKWAG